jgi:hypothetical protein
MLPQGGQIPGLISESLRGARSPEQGATTCKRCTRAGSLGSGGATGCGGGAPERAAHRCAFDVNPWSACWAGCWEPGTGPGALGITAAALPLEGLSAAARAAQRCALLMGAASAAAAPAGEAEGAATGADASAAARAAQRCALLMGLDCCGSAPPCPAALCPACATAPFNACVRATHLSARDRARCVPAGRIRSDGHQMIWCDGMPCDEIGCDYISLD